MSNARLDQNGFQKGDIFDWSEPLLHRLNITAVDAADPEGASGAADCAGFEKCRFDVAIGGTGFASLEVQAIFWNSRQSQWFGGAKYTFTKTGRHALVVDARGAAIFLKVTAFSGTSFSLNVDYLLS